MGRIEELRERIRRQQEARRPDPALIRFTDRVNAAIAGKGAYVYASESWVEKTFEAAREVPESQWDGWIVAHTEALFLSARAKPKWPDDDPSWCFHDDVPLTFLGQMLGNPDEPGSQLLIFTGVHRLETGDRRRDGLRRFYKMIVQSRVGRSVVNGIISH